jgi:hypothetical protein
MLETIKIKNMQNPLDQILEKEMDRRDFLAHIGAGFMALIGFSSILKALSGNHSSSSSTHRTGGYGGSVYGR